MLDDPLDLTTCWTEVERAEHPREVVTLAG